MTRSGPTVNLKLSANLVTGGNNNSTTFSGLVGGGSGLTKTGFGTFTLGRSAGNTYTGTTIISGGTLLAMNSTGSAMGTGAVSVSGAGTRGGTGTISGNVTNSGTVAPGANADTLHLGGSYTQSSSGRLQIELASKSSYDALAITGSANLAGTLAVSLLGGYMPQDGDVFQTLTAASRSGTFSTTSLPALSGELFWNVNYSTNSVTLAVAAPGDFNGDGSVDAADYVVWRKGLNTTYTQDDYDVWRAHFGQTTGGGSTINEISTAVPEPGALGMIVVTVVLGHRPRRD